MAARKITDSQIQQMMALQKKMDEMADLILAFDDNAFFEEVQGHFDRFRDSVHSTDPLLNDQPSTNPNREI